MEHTRCCIMSDNIVLAVNAVIIDFGKVADDIICPLWNRKNIKLTIHR